MMRKTVAVVLGVLGAAVLAGCSSDPAPDPEFDPASLCAEVDTSGALPECTAGFDEAPYLRLPESSAQSPYGALVAGPDGGGVFATTGGDLPVADSVLETIDPKVSEDDSAVDGNDYANLVYRATVSDGEVTELTPVARVSTGALMQSLLAGRSLEGQISEYTGDGYDLTPTLPVRIDLAEAVTERDGRTLLPGTVVNADQASQAQDGTAIPALADAGERNPLREDFTADVELERFPSMHSAFDDELVLAWTDSSSGMGVELFPTIADMAGLHQLDQEWQITQHGSPTSGPGLTLRLR